MQLFELLLLLVGGFAAGAIGSLFGLGGGLLIVPLLVIVLKVPIHNAVATSLICVIATSSAAASTNVRAGLANIRLGVTLEVATVTGAIAGGAIAGLLPPSTLMLLFSATLVAFALPMALRAEAPSEPGPEPDDRGFLAQLHGSFYDPAAGRDVRYGIRRFPLAMSMSVAAGALSGLFGIGGGMVTVPVLALYCGVPMKAAAATSNFIIGVTALASVLVYYGRGDVLPIITAVSVLAVFAGSRVGVRLAERTESAALRRWFALLMLIVSAQMLWKVLAG